jgi:protein phosphatase
MRNSKHSDIAAKENEIVASIQTDVGCVRSSNQDCGRFIRPTDAAQRERKGVLAVVADGMGGHSGGEVASSLATEVIGRAYYSSNSTPVEALTESFNEANRQIYEASNRDESLKGMGTTCTALAIYGNQAVVAHVGDSRLYLLREGEIYLMTEDHSAVMEMVKQGLLSLEAARHHEDKNVILRALGTAPSVDVSTWKAPLTTHIGDQFILCSDGLYDLVADSEIKEIVSATPDIHSSCEQLIDLAKRRGGHDNITVGILKAELAGTTQRAVRETREFEVVT